MTIPKPVYADDIPLGGKLGGEGMGIFGNVNYGAGDGGTAVGHLTKIVSGVIGFMTIAAGIWMLFQITVAGIAWITAGGDKGKLETARNRLTNAIVGLVIVVASWAILALVGYFFGWDILLSNSTDIIRTLMPSP